MTRSSGSGGAEPDSEANRRDLPVQTAQMIRGHAKGQTKDPERLWLLVPLRLMRLPKAGHHTAQNTPRLLRRAEVQGHSILAQRGFGSVRSFQPGLVTNPPTHR